MLCAEMAVLRHQMHQGPQPPIAHPPVIIGDVALGQGREHHRETRLIGRHPQWRQRRLATRPCDPQTPVTFKQPQEGRPHAAYRRLDSPPPAFADNPDRGAV